MAKIPRGRLEKHMLALKTKKSAGIRVEPRVYRLLQQGDAARDAGRWADAVAHYRAALARAPRLPHIQLQLGHALKEIDRLVEADAAYAEAARLRPNDHEPMLHRAHLAKRIDPSAAVAHFAAILLRDANHGEATKELNGLLGHIAPMSKEQLRVLADYVSPDIASFRCDTPSSQSSFDQTDPSAPRPLVFDLTDLVGHFRSQRLPNGIQRVQIEVLAALLDQHEAEVIAACCFVAGRDDWMEVPLALCRDLIRLAGAGDEVTDPEWQAARARLFLHLALADPYLLPWRAALVNLGVSFWVYDYYRFIRNAKAERQIRYIPLVYDMIPLVRPAFCVRGWIQDFTIWVVGLFQHADGFLAISEAAKRDLLKVAAELGHDVPADRVEVVPLDADFRRIAAPLPPAALAKWDLAKATFTLFVSTIEPRKNHALAFDAWAELLRRHGPGKVPRLVCVGRDGWMNDAVFDRLDTDPLLAAHVTIIHQVSDAELALLYRASRFTIFPSLYEGWGLPVTESLCHGRVAVIADNSSLPEAGAGLALMFASGSLPAFVRAVEKAAFDDAWRSAQETKIAAEFAPRSWAQITDQVESAQARLLGDNLPDALPPLAEPGLYYPVS
ncbi:MAG TPA: glycosyltransferase, partial [Sphingomonas sp.]|nr:glycosyltransferase [Sphingomonas sp.]